MSLAREGAGRLAIRRDVAHAAALVGAFCPLLILGLFAEGAGRYALYAMPPLSLLLAMILADRGRLAFDRKFAIAIACYGVVALVAVISGGRLDFFAIRDMILVSGSLAIFLPHFKVSELHVKGLFLVFVAALAAMAAGGKPINVAFDIEGSQGIFENQFAFCFGVLAIFFFARRRWVWFLASMAVLLVSFKRITILAALVVLAASVAIAIANPTESMRRRVWLAAVLVLTVFCLLFAMFFSVWATLIAAHFGYGGSVDAFTMGRMQLNAFVDEQAGEDGLFATLFGHGPGATIKMIVAGAGFEAPLHNDYKKIIIDYGWIGGSVILLAFIRLFSNSSWALQIMAYTAILFISDNVFVYMYYYFCCFFVVRALETPDQAEAA
jgi:hypothetical protein